jgi:hypothetical protein
MGHFKLNLISALCVSALTLSGCHNSHDSSSVQPTPVTPTPIATSALSGTAATGKPITGANVVLNCGGDVTANATTDANGAFSTSVATANLPCVATISGGSLPAGETLHSMTTTTGDKVLLNITPLSDLVLIKALQAGGVDASAWLAHPVVTNLPDAKALATAIDAIKTALTAKGYTWPTTENFSPITSSIAPATVTDAYDALLESLASALTAAGSSYPQLVSSFIGGGSFPAVTTPTPTPTPTPTSLFTAATALALSDALTGEAGNYDASVSNCKTGVPTDPNSFLPDFNKGTSVSALGFSIDATGALSFAGTTDSFLAGELHVYNDGKQEVVINAFTSGISLRTDTTAQNLTQSKTGGTTGCIVAANTIEQFRTAVDPSTRLKKIFGHGLSLVCGSKHILLNDQGQFSVNDAAFKSFDFNTEKASGSFFPSSATYTEQRFKNEDGSVSEQFNIAVFMPITLGDGTLSIDVNNLAVTGVSLGASACSAGN